ncbi:hypothetical protein HFN72_26435 [Rhizobium laguerreae]|uniref:hypothetical protein n=1 Tax=Rhizobium laguerreae TaxID=1076926 RepID=UPI001C8FC3CE|nr:hypothetical protein [Rhizobium laguerreae]MBY3529469.1 hypothetical protein [Rhizobium laguerreae]
MAIRVLPSQIIAMLAPRRHRLRNFLWHAVRGAWNNPQLTCPAMATGKDDTDLRDMEAIIQKLGSYRVIRNSYDLLHDPD